MRDYKELAKIGRTYYRDTNFCSVIAVSTICNISFGKARVKLEKAGRAHKKGVYAFQYHAVIKSRGFNLELVIGFEGTQIKTIGNRFLCTR